MFWRWFGACFALAAVPFLLKFLARFVYEEPSGLFLILGNAELALAASILSSSAALDLYLISGRSQTDKSSVFLLALMVSLIGAGFYGVASGDASEGRSANDMLVTFVSAAVYSVAAAASWFSLRVAEEVRDYDRRG